MSPADEFDAALIGSALSANIAQAEQIVRWRRAALSLGAMLVLTLAAVSISVVVARQSVHSWRESTKSNGEVLREIRSQTSPEAQQRQRQAVDQIILSIDCRNRAAIQDVLDRLERQGVLMPGQASIVGATCATTPDGTETP